MVLRTFLSPLVTVRRNDRSHSPKYVQTTARSSPAGCSWSGRRLNCLRHILIPPGRAKQNGCFKCFNSKFRDEHLSGFWFESRHQPRMAVAAWRTDDNAARPHSSLRRMPPARFAELHGQRADHATQFPSNRNPSSKLEPGPPLLIGTVAGCRSQQERQTQLTLP